MLNEIICRINQITKHFPGVVALKDISFNIFKGEVHAIVGENGAGKSTLMNILSGVYPPSSGTIEFDGKLVSFSGPKEARDAGIAMIHQELSLAPYMTAAENVYMGRMLRTKIGFVDQKAMNFKCKELLGSLGIDYINPNALVKNLSVSEMQLLEIVKALSQNSRMLIMDEPTSSLTSSEIKFLIDVIRNLRDHGKAVLYISHKLEEIGKVADTVTVLRDGCHIATEPIADMDERKMISLMVGRTFDSSKRRVFLTNYDGLQPMLEVENVSDLHGRVKNLSFQLFRGEVLGLTGLVGAGRTELLQTIFGAQKMKTGVIKVDGKEIKITGTSDAIKAGMGLVPEGRKIQGLFLKETVEDNLTAVYRRKLVTKAGFLNTKGLQDISNTYVDLLKIKTPSLKQGIINLSGGNQQKTIVARWLMNKPKILFMDEPTHGIDIGTKNEIYKIIDDLSRQGVSIVLLSSELPEVLANCDRIMVMHHGELRAILKNDSADQVTIMSYTLENAGEAAV